MSKLTLGYPVADPDKFLRFAHGWQTEIDPVFAGRLAALARDKNTYITVLSGYRSQEEQINSYKDSGGHQDENGNWIGGNGYAAKPGTSWHQYGQAIDTSDPWLKALEKDYKTTEQKTLLKYGLFKPLTVGNGKSVLEDWHIQPVETIGITDIKVKQAFYNAYKTMSPEMAVQYLTVHGRITNPTLWLERIKGDVNLGWLFIKWVQDFKD